ncbi:putative disease resistance protein RGA3 [Prosopis cineraria]|uniref:putative disease resistance protein RGA3 n=1 Tax=Prosopis cineraria TaxID=364024 RepID=UPI00240F0FA0|nr:putative disease resistance protein RGA3 [Prosopis cineraria]
MAEALLSAVFNVILERLTPHQGGLINLICGKKLDNKILQRLKPSLIAARAVLNDAELKQLTDPAVKDWLDELKDAAYDLEDLMDEISTRAATQKKVPCFSFASLGLRDTSLANKLEAISDRIEHIVALKDALDLKKTSGTETLSWRPPVMSHVKVSDIYGRKKEKEDLIKLLFDDDDGDQLSIIPIVGMGGVGKTTLVQLVYNDNDVKQKFDLTAWVCVSEAFDHLKIAQSIIKSISPDFICDNMDLSLLQHHLVKKLERKKFLVVLDDVWNDKITDWDTLKNLLQNGVEGCKILVTTRHESVALIAKTISSFYRLNVLSDEDCLSIFATHAFHSSDSNVKCLEKIGIDVASKCKGLPLAAKVLGGVFRSKPDSEDWNSVLKNVMWDLSDNEIIPASRVSYYYLPPHLKQCFAYCSLFPEDYTFRKEELILMWMAEGFFAIAKGEYDFRRSWL